MMKLLTRIRKKLKEARTEREARKLLRSVMRILDFTPPDYYHTGAFTEYCSHAEKHFESTLSTMPLDDLLVELMFPEIDSYANRNITGLNEERAEHIGLIVGMVAKYKGLLKTAPSLLKLLDDDCKKIDEEIKRLESIKSSKSKK